MTQACACLSWSPESHHWSFSAQLTWSPDEMQVPLGGSTTFWGNDVITSLSVCPVTSLRLSSTSVQCVSRRAEGSKVGLEGGEKADFPEVEASCG